MVEPCTSSICDGQPFDYLLYHYRVLCFADNDQLEYSVMNGKLNRSTMSKKSTPKTPDASGDTLNAADIDKVRSAVELHRETEAKNVESGDETRSYESNGSETSEHLYTSS